MVAIPHYLLFAEANGSAGCQSWRFVLQDVDSSRRMVVADREESDCGERLELLAVVRGLEALSGPSRVTLVTKSRYVSRGLRFGIVEWRANGWQWERFGRVVPVKDHDLWQRVDRALLFHQVECQAWHFGAAALTDEPPSCPELAADGVEAWSRGEPVVTATTRLAPTKRPVAGRASRGHRAALVSHEESARRLRAALATKVAAIRQAIREMTEASHQLATGAA